MKKNRRTSYSKLVVSYPILDLEDLYIPSIRKEWNLQEVSESVEGVLENLLDTLSQANGGRDSIYTPGRYGKMNLHSSISFSHSWDFIRPEVRNKVVRPEDVVLSLTFSDEKLESTGVYIFKCEVRREINLNPNAPNQNKRIEIIDSQTDEVNASLFFPDESIRTVEEAEQMEGFADNLLSFIGEEYRLAFCEWGKMKVKEGWKEAGNSIQKKL